MNNKLLYEFRKNSAEKVRVTETFFKGRKYIDIRIWLTGNNPANPGSEQPTKKGICLSVELLPRLVQALRTVDLRTEDIKSDEESEPEDFPF